MHVIRSAVVQLSASDARDPFGLQREVSAWAHEQLPLILGQAFDALAGGDRHLVLDRLELTVTVDDPTAWREQTRRQLEAELRPAFHQKSATVSAGGGLEVLGEQESFGRKLAYYLEHGVLPWSAAESSRPSVETAVQQWLDAGAAREQRALFVAVLASHAARRRFWAMTSTAGLRQALVQLFDVALEEVERWIAELQALELEPGFRRMLRAPPPAPASAGVHRALLEGLLEGLAAGRTAEAAAVSALRTLLALPPSGLPDAAFAPALRGSPLLRAALEPWPDRTPVGAGPESAPRRGLLTTVPADSQATHLPPPAEPERRTSTQQRSPAREGIFVHNAGLILIAPYLPRLFERLDISCEAELRDVPAALSLLHYLASGEESPLEFQLALPKVLCGLALAEACDVGPIGDRARDEASKLLGAVVEHWSVLKNTSIPTLREAFLQRQGKLSAVGEQDWLLQVEQRAYDMLVQHVPWSFALVRLPWMKGLLTTEWVH